MFRISLVRIFLQKHHHQALDGVGVYFHVCDCAEGRVHEGRGNVKLQKKEMGNGLVAFNHWKTMVKKNVYFFF